VDEIAGGEEKYSIALDCETGRVTNNEGFHHHIYLRTKENYFLEEIRDLFVCFTSDDTYSINVQCCRSPKASLLYLSKEDKWPFLNNVRVSQLSLYARAWHHAVTTYLVPGPVNRAHPFIIAAGINSRFVFSIIDEHMANLRRKKADDRIVLQPNQLCGDVNEIMNDINLGFGHLYIEGDPGLGKTELIDFLLKGKSVWKAGEPSSFLFGTLPDSIDYVWFEDFQDIKYEENLCNILSLMDFKPTTVSKKCIDDRMVITHARFIFTSNYDIGDRFNMLRRRVKKYTINHKLYQCIGCRNFVPDNQQVLLDIE